jgi:methionyl-tRNA formyltransferase
MVAVAYGQILRPNFLAIPPKGVLNVHPSLLPRWRGASPVQAAILAGEIETGVTIMLMDAGMDSGPILAQDRAPVDDDDTARTLLDRLSEHGARLLTETLPPWLAGALIPQPQDDDLATTCPLIRKEDGRIDWSQPAREIALRVRAFNPWPGAYTQFGTETLHIWRAHPIYDALDLAPGVVFPTPEAFAVHTGDGALEVLEAQRPSRRPLPAPELLRGMPTLIGSRLGA